MTTMLDSIRNEINSFYSNAPEAPFVGATKSFIYSGLIMTVFTGGNLPAAALYASFGAVASLIYTAVTPIFMELNAQKEKMGEVLFLSRVGVSVILAELIVFRQVNLSVVAIIVNFVINLFQGEREITSKTTPIMIGGFFSRNLNI